MGTLNDFIRPQGGRRGGVRRLWLANAADVEWVSLMGNDTCYALSAEFAEYEFAEDTAVYQEDAVTDGGAVKIVHKLSFALPVVDTSSAASVMELSDSDGVVALMETGCGDCLLVGYTAKFRLERPLRLVSCDTSTGGTVADMPLRVITLCSEDTSTAIAYTGELPERGRK